jgi:hypothetical protein
MSFAGRSWGMVDTTWEAPKANTSWRNAVPLELPAEAVLFALKQTGASVIDELSVRAYP